MDRSLQKKDKCPFENAKFYFIHMEICPWSMNRNLIAGVVFWSGASSDQILKLFSNLKTEFGPTKKGDGIVGFQQGYL